MSSLEKSHRKLRNKKFISQSKAMSLHQTFTTNRFNPHSLHPLKQRTCRPIPVYLFYKKEKIIIKANKGMQYSKLKQLLYSQIINYQYTKTNSSQAAKKAVMKVLGFCTCNNNLKVDYMLSLSQGCLNQSLLLECFMTIKKKDRISSYQIYNCLAIGGFSKVYLARSRQNGEFYVIKFIKKKDNEMIFNQSSIDNEMKICQQANHPFIVKIRQGFETENFHCMVFEYCPGGQLFYLLKRIKRMNEEHAKFYFLQILLGIKFLHQNLIIYRDLKPENILIDYTGNVKIVDFGLSKKLQNDRVKTYSFCGSTEYMAPQMILRMGHSFAIDYYSLGALLYQLVVGLPPFYSKDQQILKKAIVQEDLVFPNHISLSDQIKDLLSRLLHKDSKIRLGSYIGIKQILCHPWIKKIKINQILDKKIICPFPTNLEQYNFDINELGDDQEEFTAVIHQDIAHSKAKNRYKTFITPPKTQILRDSPIISPLIEQIKLKQRHSCRNVQNKQNKVFRQNCLIINRKSHRNKPLNSNTIFQKNLLSKKCVRYDNLNSSVQKDCSRIDENHLKDKIDEKLMPYLTKNIGHRRSLIKKSSNKKIPKSNILKIKVYGKSMADDEIFQ